MLNLAVIGTGRYGKNIIDAFKQLERQGLAQLVSICEINRDLLDLHCERYQVKGYTDYTTMFEKEKIDAVAIATPDHLHREPCVYAAKLGKHILVEKPMDVSVEGCLEIMETAKKNNVLIQVDFHKRYDPHHQQLCKDVRSGKFGIIEYGYVHMEDRIEVPSKWFSSWAHMSSPVWFLGVHFIDLVRWCINSNGKCAYATGHKIKLKQMRIDTYDSVSAKVLFENDVSGKTVYKGYGIESISDFVYNVRYLKDGGDFGQLKKNSISAFGEDGLEVTKIAAAIHKSLETGEPVFI
ncbi:MAG: Gfo/Idh/MocA family oxidoreductase [Candidatus Omnitrophica bacterium]|nr:Gfo/Idh/MocA family oxidoreductase [Candidatus Omnitrophota bacterium]MCM8828898.1 Gfo/Idh/MocA family oxidoreductase [Candidatus Omnitrophota bacterium]